MAGWVLWGHVACCQGVDFAMAHLQVSRVFVKHLYVVFAALNVPCTGVGALHPAC